MADRVDQLVALLVPRSPGIRSCRPPSTRYANWSGAELKREAIRLQPLTGKSKSACAREFGVVRETLKDWLDPLNRPRSCPPENFVEWLACHVDARSLVRVA